MTEKIAQSFIHPFLLNLTDFLFLLFFVQVKKSEYYGDWTPDESSGSSMFASMTPGDELTYDLRGLQPSTYYRAEISAKNHLGSSHPTYLVFKTANFTDGESMLFHLCLHCLLFYTQKKLSFSVHLSLCRCSLFFTSCFNRYLVSLPSLFQDVNNEKKNVMNCC